MVRISMWQKERGKFTEKHYSICYFGILLVIIMSISGICQKNSQADSVLLYTDFTEAEPYIFYVEEAIINVDSCTAEQLGIHNPEGYISQFGTTAVKNSIPAVVILPPRTILPPSPVYLPEMSKTGEKVSAESGKVIIGYIHHQDGEKGFL